MYTCETCSKEYTLQKRYLSHIDRCESRSRSRSGRSMVALTDIEDDPRSRSRSRSIVTGASMSQRDTVERLMKDKAKYKAEIKKYKGDIRSRVSEHRDELERNQEYFQEIIFALTEERDDFAEQVNSAQEQIFNEKERLRSDFANKVAAEKKRIESRYGGKNSTRLQQLQTTVDKLQEKLSSQLVEKEQLREQHDSLLTARDDQGRSQIEQMDEQLRNMRRCLDQERENFRKATLVFQNEKDTALAVLRKEKDQEFNNVVNDKSSVISSLEFTLGNLQKDKDMGERNHIRECQDISCTHELAMKERNKAIDRLKDTHVRTVDQHQNKYDSFMRAAAEKSKQDLASSAEIQRKALAMKDAHHTDRVNDIISEFTCQIQELSAEICIHKKKSHETDRDCKVMMGNLQKDCDDFILSSEKNYLLEKEKLESDLQKSHLESTNDRDNTIVELERLNHSLGAQVGHYRSAMDNMKTDTSRIKQQFIDNLNIQIKDSEKAVSEREDRIKNMEAEIQSIHRHTTLQLDDAGQKLSSIASENTKLREDITAVSTDRDEISQRMKNIDLQLSTVTDKYKKRIDSMKTDFSTTINKQHNSIVSEYQQKLDVSEKRVHESAVHLNQIVSESARTMTLQRQQLLDHSNIEKQSLRAAAEKSKETAERLNIELQNSSKKFVLKINELTTQETESSNTLRKVKEDLFDKNDQLTKLKTLSKSLHVKNNDIQSQMQRERQNLALERSQFIATKEELVKKANTPVRDTTIEIKLKKMRDDCVEALRRQKIELNNLKQDNTLMKRQLLTFESDTKKHSTELTESSKTNISLKNSYDTNLNAQKDESEKAISTRDARISELETMLSSAVRKITSEPNVPKITSNPSVPPTNVALKMSYIANLNEQQARISELEKQLSSRKI